MSRRGHRPSKPQSGRPRFWGKHAVTAALANPERVVRKIWGTKEALGALDLPPVLPIVYADAADLGRLVPGDAPHQGLVAEVDALEDVWLADLIEQGRDDMRPLVVLDQVTDPHNVGAILRSAAAFGAAAVIVPDRHAPPETGTLAKSASGALETVPYIHAGNLSQTIEKLKGANFWLAGMDGYAEQTLAEAKLKGRVGIIMGSEGEGLRRLTRENCDFLVKLPMSDRIESLNVSNAAAVALYELYRR
jgi:23S rRNA (guanosine2251-2'-O)-methyltransferase